MESLPQIPAEMIGSFDFVDISVLRLVSRQSRSAFTPYATRITVIPGDHCDRFLSSMTVPFSSRTIVRLFDVWDCMSLLDKYPALWCNIQRVICTDSGDRRSSWLPFFSLLFPRVDSLEVRFQNDDPEPFVVGQDFARFHRDLTIHAFSMRIEADLNVQNLSLHGEILQFAPVVRVSAECAHFVGTSIHALPESLTVEREFSLDRCLVMFPSEGVLGPVFVAASEVSLVGRGSLLAAFFNRVGMAAKTLVLELGTSHLEMYDYMILLPRFFAEGPLLVERLTLRNVPMNCMAWLYGLQRLRYLDLTPSPSSALCAPPPGLAHLIVRFCPSFFGGTIVAMTTYVGALRVVCQSQRVQRLSVYLYDVHNQPRIRDVSEPTMTIHDGAP